MNFIKITILVCCLGLVACQAKNHLVKSDSANKELKELKEEDAAINEIVSPYKAKLKTEMNAVIGQAAKDLTKAQPESTLGNWACDLVHKKCEDYTKQKVDFAVLNYGGLRIPTIAKGDVTKSKIFELMPFDNLLVLVEMKGSELPELFHHIAVNEGWPLSKHVKMVIQGNKAVDVRIKDKKVVPDQTYLIATNDYIANGGDKCSFFKGKKQITTGVLFRDAIIEFVTEETKANRMLDANIERRIFILK